MKIIVNDKPFETHKTKLVEVLQVAKAKTPFVVAINGEFVPQPSYASRIVEEGDVLEILAPVFGG